MADEKDIKAEELTDEQADEVSGGGKAFTQKFYNCFNHPRCREKVHSIGEICEKCMAKRNGN